MQSLSHRALFTFLALAWITAASAQSTEEEDLALAYGDKSTVSIATGSQQSITRAPSAATVITARDIEAMGATDLDQVLESVPGLHVTMSSIALAPVYVFRGIQTKLNSEVLVLVNGIQVTQAFNGDRSQIWGGMPLENVARIEVIRGPGSALYGADAFAGVINVITKTAADIKGTETGVRVGSFNSRDAWLQHGGKLASLEAAFYLRAGNTDGQKGIIQRDAQSAWDAALGTHASLAPGPINAERKAIDVRTDLSKEAWRFRAAYQKREVGGGLGVGGSLDPNGRGHSSRLYLDLSYEQANWARNWDVSALVGFSNNKEYGSPAYTLFPAGAFNDAFKNGMIGSPGHSERHEHASVTAFYSGFEQHRVRVGIGYRVDDLYAIQEQKNYDKNGDPLPGVVDATGDPNLVYLFPHKRNLSFVFAQDEWSLAKDWALTVGVRRDQYSDFGSTTNPRLALVWDAAYNVVVKAMHGKAFRAPSFVEQYAINNPVTVGTPNIRPETITTDELEFSWQATSTLKNDLNFFRYRMRDIILPVATATSSAFQNSGDQIGRGFELETTLDASNNLRLSGSYSVQHSRDSATGQDSGIAPHRRLFVRTDWRFAPLWQIGASVNYVADRMREPGDTRDKVPDYTTVDISLQHEMLADNWEVRAMVRNLFNRDAREPTLMSAGTTVPGNPVTLSDLPLAGRSAYIQLQLNL